MSAKMYIRDINKKKWMKQRNMTHQVQEGSDRKQLMKDIFIAIDEDGSGTMVGRAFIGASGSDQSSGVSTFVSNGFTVGTSSGYINDNTDVYTAVLFGQSRLAGS